MGRLAPGYAVTPTVTLVRELAGGGMGRVWLAQHMTLHTTVVVKFLSPESTTSPDAIERFSREASAAAQVRSPHVVQMFDHGTSSRSSLCSAWPLGRWSCAHARARRLRRRAPRSQHPRLSCRPSPHRRSPWQLRPHRWPLHPRRRRRRSSPSQRRALRFPARSRGSTMRRSFSVLFAIAALSLASIAAADAAEHAKTLYNEGLDLRDSGDHQGAKKMFEAALARVRSPIVALDLAREHIALGELVAALSVAESIAKISVAPEETEKSTQARADAVKLAADLEKRVATLQIVTAPALIVIDGARVEDGSSRRVDPGKHVVYVNLMRYDVDLKEGETKKLVVESPKAPEPVAPIAPLVDSKRDYTLTYVGLGTAGVGLVVGTVTGIMALSRANTIRDKCDGAGACASDPSRDVSSVRTLGTVSTISFAVAGGGLILTAFGFTRASETTTARVRPFIGVASAGISGAF